MLFLKQGSCSLFYKRDMKEKLKKCSLVAIYMLKNSVLKSLEN